MPKRILIYANCQGLVVAKAVRAHPDLAAADIRVLENYKDDPAVVRVAASSDLVLAQVVHGEKFRKRFAAITAALPPEARIVRFPAMHASHLWPQFFQDYTVKPEPGYKHGRFPWGDKLLINLVRQGLPKAEVLDQYLSADLAGKFDLKGLYRLALGGMQQLETECDVAISDIYEQSIFERQTFFSPYHAANHIVNVISNRLFAALGLRTLQEDELPQGNLLRDAELPIHRSVASFFGVKFIHPDTTYLSRTGAQVSERELCAEYVDWLLQRQAEAAKPAAATA
ncbi:MAG TPA: WcbI family polysaccharide biosynthesis putative acetyltransferase [Vineibacter sp.]|nr:WcbI family polysaccharide biosynthesis putative acetyltransferase [Vineibacter sp.]